ncbi:unnamed protein product [Effrenium voratum]|nr:unnamed protein product [Effrenium voratum]
MGVPNQDHAAPDYLFVTGAEAVLLPYMGTFYKTGIQPSALQAYRQIYQNVNGKQLYYRAAWGLWLLSDADVHDTDVWMGRAYAKDDVDCPTHARGWIVWDGSSWNTEYAVHITETDGIEDENSEAARPLQLLHVKQPPPPAHLSLREAEEALGLPKARELVTPLKLGLQAEVWISKNGVWTEQTLKVDHRNNFLVLSSGEDEKQEWRLQQVMAVLDGVGALNLCGLLGITMPELTRGSQAVALHGFWEGAAKRENILAFHCETDEELPARLRAAVSLAPHPGAAIRAAAKVLQAQQRFRAMRQDLKQRASKRGSNGVRGFVAVQVRDAQTSLMNAATTWPPSNVLELEMVVRPAGSEIETHVAEIPARFKPEKALVIAEKIAVQVSEDLHVLDKEMLTQEIKEVLKLFRWFSNMPAKGDRGKLFMTDAPISSVMQDNVLASLLKYFGESKHPLASCMMQRLSLEQQLRRLTTQAEHPVVRIKRNPSLPLVARDAEPFGTRVWAVRFRACSGDNPAVLEVDQSLQGKWFYHPGGCFEIKPEDGELYFDEQVDTGERYRGALQAAGAWFTAQLYCEGTLQGTMRIRSVGDSLKANFRESPEEPWSPEIVASRTPGLQVAPRENTNSSVRSNGRGPLASECRQTRTNSFSAPSPAELQVGQETPSSKQRSAATLEELRLEEIFSRFDKDRSGFLDLAELRQLCAEMGHPLSDEQAALAMSALDRNTSGNCSYDEFKTWWFSTPSDSQFSMPALDFLKFSSDGFSSIGLAWPRVVDEVRLKEVFKNFDRDRSGFIDLKELQLVSEELGMTLSVQEVEDAMRELSKNKGDTCSFEDFRSWWMEHNSQEYGVLGRTLMKAGLPFGLPWKS